jgi:hypothetical protein
MGTEKVQSLPQDPVISVLGFLQFVEIGFQIFLGIKRCPIDSLKLFVAFIPPPVSA